MTQRAHSYLPRAAAPTHTDLPALPDDLSVDLTGEHLGVDVRPAAIPYLEPHEGLLGASRWGHALKRGLDVVVAVLGLLILALLLVIVAASIRLTSPGPVFYVQERVGQHGRRIRFRKFRTMRVDAHVLKHRLAGQNESDGPIFKIRNDPRITPVGRILRKLSIDELPQLLHVLKGEMTLVGPRPPLPEEVETYSAWELQRLWVKPGITCIWQVSGRSDLDFETWVQMDVEYIRRWTPWLDLELLARTIPAVLTGRGAY